MVYSRVNMSMSDDNRVFRHNNVTLVHDYKNTIWYNCAINNTVIADNFINVHPRICYLCIDGIKLKSLTLKYVGVHPPRGDSSSHCEIDNYHYYFFYVRFRQLYKYFLRYNVGVMHSFEMNADFIFSFSHEIIQCSSIY